MEYCAERAVTPHWDAWTNNLASVAVAEKAGFQWIETYTIYVGDLGGIGRIASRFAVEGHG
jgi:RimJ/RimL family protein N-acetyltransferase